MKLAVISDMHKMEASEAPCGQRMGAWAVPLLKAALHVIAVRGDVDAICIGGDCVDRADNQSGLREIRDAVVECARCPVVAIPGNHDPAPDLFYSVFKHHDYLDVCGVRIVPFCDAERPEWNAERTAEAFRRADRICAGFGGMKVFLQHVPLYPSSAPGLRYKYLNADQAVASMKKTGAVLSVSGHQHEGVSLYEHDGMSFVCAPALCEPPHLFLVLSIDAAGKTTSETVSVDQQF